MDFELPLSYIKIIMLKKFITAKKGATAIEYAIIASMLSVVIIVGLEATGIALKDSYETTGAKLEDAFEAAAGKKPVSPNLQPSPDAP
jgi:Flp pilus assembly pilin Flp